MVTLGTDTRRRRRRFGGGGYVRQTGEQAYHLATRKNPEGLSALRTLPRRGETIVSHLLSPGCRAMRECRVVIFAFVSPHVKPEVPKHS